MSKAKETPDSLLLRQNLLEIARAYCKGTGKTMASVSKEIYGNQALLPALARGKGTVSLLKWGEMIAKFRESWPDEKVDWPFLPALFVGRRNNL